MPRIEALSCPSCSGVVLKPQNGYIAKCDFCNSNYYFDDSAYIPEYIATPGKTASASEIISRISTSSYLPKDLFKTLRIISKESYFIPFYRATGIRAGIIEAEILKGTEDNNRWRLSSLDTEDRSSYRPRPFRFSEIIKKEDTRCVMGDFDYYFRGATLKTWEIENLDIKKFMSGDLKIEARDYKKDIKLGHFIKPDLPVERMIERGIESFETSKAKMTTIEINWSIVYYPVISIIFQYRRRIYECLFDGVNYSIIWGRLPCNPNLLVLGGVSLLSAGSLSAGVSLQHFLSMLHEAFSPSFHFFSAMLLLCIGLVFLLFSWNIFTSPFFVEFRKDGFLIRGLNAMLTKIIGSSADSEI